MFKKYFVCLTTCLAPLQLVVAMESQSIQEDPHIYYLNAQEYFQLASEYEINSEDKRAALSLAVDELKKGVAARDRDSIYWMAEFYKDGLTGVIYRNEKESKKLMDQIEQLSQYEPMPPEDLQLMNTPESKKHVGDFSSARTQDSFKEDQEVQTLIQQLPLNTQPQAQKLLQKRLRLSYLEGLSKAFNVLQNQGHSKENIIKTLEISEKDYEELVSVSNK